MDIQKYKEVFQSNLTKNADCLVLKKNDKWDDNDPVIKKIHELVDTIPGDRLFIKNANMEKSNNTLIITGSIGGSWSMPTIENGTITFLDKKAILALSYDLKFQTEKVELKFDSTFTFGPTNYDAVTSYGLNIEGNPTWSVKPTLKEQSINFLSAFKLIAPESMRAMIPPNVPSFSAMAIGGSAESDSGSLAIEFSPLQKEGEIIELEARSTANLVIVQDKLSIKGISIATRVSRSLLDDNGYPMGVSSTKVVLKGLLDIGDQSCIAALMVSPSGINLMQIEPEEDKALPSLYELSGLIGGSDLKSKVKSAIKTLQISTLTLDRIQISFDLDKKKIHRAFLQAHLLVHDLRFDVSASLPDFAFSGMLAPNQSASLKPLLVKTFGNAGGFPDAAITDAQVYVKSVDKSFRLNLTIDTDVSFTLVAGKKLLLKQLSIDLNTRSSKKWGRASCLTTLFGQTLRLSLSKDSPESEWKIKAATPADEKIPLGKMQADFLGLFNFPLTLPEQLTNASASAEYVDFEYGQKTKNVSFSGQLIPSKKWLIPMGPSNIELDKISCWYQKEGKKTSGSISAEIMLGDIALDVNYQAPGPLTFKSALPELPFGPALSKLATVSNLSVLPIPDGFFDFSLTDTEVIIETESKTIGITGTANGIGDLSANFIKRASWESIIEFTLGNDFKFSNIKSELSFLDVINLGGGQLLFSSFSTKTGEGVNVAGASLNVVKGLNITLPADLFKLEALSFLNSLTGGGKKDDKQLVSGSVSPSGQWQLQATIPPVKLLKGITIHQAGVRMRSSSLGAMEVGLYGQFELDIDNPALLFEVSANLEPGGTEIQGYLEEWDSPFNIKGISLKKLRLIVGTNLAGVPTIGVSGQAQLGEVKGTAALVFDSKDATQSMAAMKFKRLSFGLLLRSLFSPVVKVPATATKLADVVTLKDVDFRVVPPGVQFPEYKKGVSLDGQMEVGIGPIKLKGTSEGIVELPKGIRLKGYLDPFKLGGLIEIGGAKSNTNPNGGAGYDLNLLLTDANPSFKVNGDIALLGLNKYKGQATISTKALSVDVKQKQGPISYDLKFITKDFQNATVTGGLNLGLNIPVPALTISVAGVSIPVWPAFKLTSGLKGDLSITTAISANPVMKVSLKNMGFQFSGQNFTVPALTISVKANDFQSLPSTIEKHIAKNIEKIFKALIDAAKKQALAVFNEIADLGKAAAKEILDIESKAQDTAKAVGKETAKLATDTAKLLTDVTKLDETAKQLVTDTGKLAAQTAAYVADAGKEVANLGGQAASLAINQSKQLKNIGNAMANQASKYAKTAVKLLSSLASILNPFNW